MAAIDIDIKGAEGLGDVFALTLQEVKEARGRGVAVEVAQDRMALEAAIFLVARFAEPYVKEFVTKFLGKLAEHLADKVASGSVEPFTVSVNGQKYVLPKELARMRTEQGLAA